MSLLHVVIIVSSQVDLCNQMTTVGTMQVEVEV